MLTQIFYTSVYGGKMHRADLCGVSLCSSSVLVDLAGPTIHNHPRQDTKPHPFLCKRCLAKS